MGDIVFTDKDEQMIQKEFESLLADYRNTHHRQKVELITKAFHFAKNAHQGVRRKSGEPYIMHPLAVAKIVVKEIGLGSTSICCALLHDVVEDTEYTVEDIQNLFGDKIASIVDGLTKISGGVFGKQANIQAENFRKLLLTMSEDVRVILIKIADRLHNMRTLEYQPIEKQYKIAGETQYIYAPLAHRLGLFTIKTELENLSFKYEHPDTYKEISDKLEAIKSTQLAFFEKFADPIRERLKQMGYEFEIAARIKSVYSIWNKMQAKGIAFEDVYDLLAVRIIFEPKPEFQENDQCWMLYSAITAIYKPHPERIRDWISTPKANGYEALHVTVMGQNGQWVEVQIRSRRMHEIAERGLAAHWKYKTGEKSESELDKWLKQLKDILQSPEPNAMEFLDTFKLNLYASEMFVFTPSGDIHTMPKGSTALDFAFMLHTDLGAHCIGAKVNRRLEPLNYVLKAGDQIEILTAEEQTPKEEWINIVTTAKAKGRLKSYFRRQNREFARKGEELFNEKLKELNITDKYDSALYKLQQHYQIYNKTELFQQIGNGIIVLDDVEKIFIPKQQNKWLKYLNPFSNNKNKNTDIITTDSQKERIKQVVLTEDNFGKQYHIAQCCHPIPGDEVLGYQDPSGEITIHKRFCPVATRLKSVDGKHICNAIWETHRKNTFIETIELQGIDRVGVIISVLHIISDQFKINIHDLHITAENGIFSGIIQLHVYDKQEIIELLKTIRKVPNIESVQRIDQIDGIEEIEELD